MICGLASWKERASQTANDERGAAFETSALLQLS
jgi:hypothetical protein